MFLLLDSHHVGALPTLPFPPQRLEHGVSLLLAGRQAGETLFYDNARMKNRTDLNLGKSVYHLSCPDSKQLLDEVFVISRIIEVEVGVISRSRRPRLITLTETSIILNITKTESNNCFIIHWTEKIEVIFFASSLTPSSTKRANLTWLLLEIMHRGHTWHDYPWPWHGYNLVPRVSLLCLPWSLEERPWLRLVMWPPRIWVAKKSVGSEGW